MKYNYLEIPKETVDKILESNVILIVTATDLETENTHKLVQPINGYNDILYFVKQNITIYFGVLGKYIIAHVQCSMGSISRTSSIKTVTSAIEIVKSKVVIMVGIAFGVDETKQKIGDVLISESVIPYNNKRVGEEATIHRGQESIANSILINRFKSVKVHWEFYNEVGEKLRMIFTRILSGEELIDNKEHRDSLKVAFPESEGGEMEGAGLASACDGNADWILLKGICDFADGKKNVDKKSRQTLAINSALSILIEVLNSEFSMKDFGINPITASNSFSSDKSSVEFNNSSELVLFDFYENDCEPFYIQRSYDGTFDSQISQFGIWISGPSGCGKSNLIIRNLVIKQKEYLQINLANYVGESVEKYFEEIFYELKAYIKETDNEIYPPNFQLGIKRILILLENKFKGKEFILFIEEIPISDNSELFRDFSKKIFSFISSKNLIPSLQKTRIVLSSINNPLCNIVDYNQKVHQHIKFIELDYWIEKDILLLIKMIQEQMNFTISDDILAKLKTTCLGSPRFIKKFFRNVFVLNKVDDESLLYAINETKKELNL